MHDPLTYLAAAQAIYFALTGLWPLAHMQSFIAITGPKRDLWLVKTVGILVTVIGAVLALAAYRVHFPLEIFVLAAGSAAALAAVDVVYVLRRVIDRIYLLDAVAEALIILGWAIWWRP